MPYPGNAAAVEVKAIYFPTNNPHSGPGYPNAKPSLRPYYPGSNDSSYKILYYPALRQFFIQKFHDGEVTHSGYIPESNCSWWEPLETE